MQKISTQIYMRTNIFALQMSLNDDTAYIGLKMKLTS